MFDFKGWKAAIAAALVIGFASGAQADEVLASRLGALLGQERSALAIIPDNRLAALTTVPSAAERGIATAAQQVAYNASFLASQPAITGGPEWECLSEALYHEARGESTRGMFAVGEVILNRVDSNQFPNSICAVVHEGTGRKYACQFTWTCDGRSDAIGNRQAFNTVGKVARLLMAGTPRTLTDGATYYHTTAVSPSWSRRFQQTTQIGVHLFYRPQTRSASN